MAHWYGAKSRKGTTLRQQVRMERVRKGYLMRVYLFSLVSVQTGAFLGDRKRVSDEALSVSI